MRTCLLRKPLREIRTSKLCFDYLLVGLLTRSFHPIILKMSTEHITDTQIVPNVVGALFGVYLFYTSQIHSKDKLHVVSRIPIPIGGSPFFALRRVLTESADELQTWLSLPERPDISDTLRPYVIYILKSLLESGSFHALPHSSTNPHNPIALPHSILIEDPKATISAGASKSKGKVGRPTKRQKLQQHLDNWTILEAKISGSPQTSPATDKLNAYLEKKSAIIDLIPKDMEKDAEKDVVAALEKIAIGKEGKGGLRRLEEVLKDGDVLKTWNPVPGAPAPPPAVQEFTHTEANETASSAGIE